MKMSEKLVRAREYEKSNIVETIDGRPLFHVTGAVGWINDPNGFGMYKGEYHLFYQYHPYSNQWGPMHWGHVKSDDFVKWTRLPVAMAPDEKYDSVGCFSGSSLELSDGRHLLIYTGVSKRVDAEGKEHEYQQQCVAIGDGVDYEKVACNPVISTEMLPPGGNTTDFRDPKIWKEGNCYYVAVANRAADGCGQILLYESEDAVSYRLKGVVDQSAGQLGRMWECPDYFALGDKKILIISPQEMTGDGMEIHPGNNSLFVVGEAPDWIDFKRESMQQIDYGMDFYAPQTMRTADGRRMMIAWMQSWDTCHYASNEYNYYGEMTFPRELICENGEVRQQPAREIEKYYGDRVEYKGVEIKDEISLLDVEGRAFDMTVCVSDMKSDSVFEIKLAKDDEHEVSVEFDCRKHIIKLNRTRDGITADILAMREFPAELINGRLKLRLLMDRHSLELFVNEGRRVATMKIFAPVEAAGITFSATKPVVLELVKYDLEEKLK